MNIAIVFPLLALMVGALTAFQPLVNAGLNKHVDSPIWVSFISFVIGTVILFIVGIIVNGKFMTIETEGLKWWMFLSGFLGAAYVTSALIVVPYLGTATLAALATCGVLIMAALLDHFGILSESANPITWQKMVGLALLGAGAIITLKA